MLKQARRSEEEKRAKKTKEGKRKFERVQESAPEMMQSNVVEARPMLEVVVKPNDAFEKEEQGESEPKWADLVANISKSRLSLSFEQCERQFRRSRCV
jgi:hypothetical protein